jgi:integral membrane sensor domain MASE1
MDTPQRRDDAWAARERYWRRKLGRLRLGAEPVEVQIERYRRVTLVLTAIPVVLALMFLTLFTAFRRPDIGAVLALVLFGPLVAIAWIDHALLVSRARAYLRERLDHERGQRKDPSGTEASPTGPGGTG